jgi:ABC-2 type transport system ATP-binding protein
LREVRKVYRRVAVLDRINLDLPAGSVLGLVGPNGSGKTTLLRLLLGLARPTAGSIELLGKPMPDGGCDVLPMVGALVDGPGFQPFLSGRENLSRCAAAEPMLPSSAIHDAVESALHRVGLASSAADSVADRAYRSYSTGMKQRLGLAVVLLAPRRLVVLDEPTNGLDPAGSRDVRRMITEIRGTGGTVLLSSHQLAEVEATCTHVAVLAGGTVVATGELDTLLESGGPAMEIATSEPSAALTVLRAARITGFTERGLVIADLNCAPPDEVLRILVQAGIPVAEARRRHIGLDELFTRLTEETM